jgi:hypothetical protein
MSAEERRAYFLVLTVVGIIVVLMLLWLLLMREQVKKSLRVRGLTPRRVRWRPFAYWAGVYSTAFRVIYADPLGLGHQARCQVSRLDLSVRWIDDEIGYLDHNLPMIGRVVYLMLSVILAWFGLRCLLAGKLALPPTLRHPAPLVLEGRPLILLAAAAFCGAVNLAMALSYGYAGQGKERSYTIIARGFSVVGWCLFLASLLIYTFQGMHKT